MPEPRTNEHSILWVQGATCTGCSVSVLNSVAPDARNLLLDEIIPGHHLNLCFLPTIMAGAGEIAMGALNATRDNKKGEFLLVVEGAIPTADDGAYCSVGEDGDTPIRFNDLVEQLAADALAVLCLGTCASYGGIFGANPNPTGCMGVGDFFQKQGITTPHVNVPGCPPHPDWFVTTVATLLLGGIPRADQLDDDGRLLSIYGKLVHENCQRRAYFDEGKFAKHFGEEGCLYELGCNGPVTYADCPTRLWNHGTNWCVGSGGPCAGCTQPEFPDLVSPLYQKLEDVPIPVIGECWTDEKGE